MYQHNQFILYIIIFMKINLYCLCTVHLGTYNSIVLANHKLLVFYQPYFYGFKHSKIMCYYIYYTIAISNYFSKARESREDTFHSLLPKKYRQFITYQILKEYSLVEQLYTLLTILISCFLSNQHMHILNLIHIKKLLQV